MASSMCYYLHGNRLNSSRWIDIHPPTDNNILLACLRLNEIAHDRDFYPRDFDQPIRVHDDSAIAYFQCDLRGGFDINLVFRRGNRYLLFRGCRLRMLYSDYLVILDLNHVIGG